MSSATSRSSTKKSEPRSLKPILPKPAPHVIEINVPTLGLSLKKCFVCDEPVHTGGVLLTHTTTQVTNTDLPRKIGQLVGEQFMVVVTGDDLICRKCHALVNHVDKLESDLLLVKKSLRNHLKRKYGLTDVHMKDAAGNDGEAEYVVLNEESEEDLEPNLKRLRGVPQRFRAIKPKPPDQTQLLKCPGCNFITTQHELLACHRLMCNTQANATHKCTMCDLEFYTQKGMREHKMEAHLTKWVCHFCDVSFGEEASFTSHMKSHLGDRVRRVQNGDLQYKCGHCPQSFEALRLLKIHLVSHRVNTITFRCVRCDVGFQSKDELLAHVKSHDGPGKELGVKEEEPEMIYSCPMCALSFLQEDVYLEHLGTHEDHGGMALVCTDCGEKLDSEEALHMHRLTQCVGADKDGGAEAGPEALSSLLNVQFIDGAVVLQDPEKGDNTVEDMIATMFQGEEEEEEEKPVMEDIEEKAANEVSTYVCGDCEFSATELGTLKAHFLEKHEMFKCGLCDRMATREDMNRHVEEEHGEGGGARATLQCDQCPETFPSRKALHLHEATHQENLTIQCPDCDEKFTRDKFLNEHRDAAHPVSRCRFCKKEFHNVKQLKSHESRHSRGDKTQFKCTECERVFQTPTGLRHHKANHTGEFKYKCEFCSKGFVSRVRYEEHRASHTKEERYSCEICGKKFSFQATYWIHRKWHDNPTPYKCEYCGRLFKHTSLLAVHKRKHTGERPYECPHCEQTFTVGNTLKRHLMLHTGVFPFTCRVCQQGFSARHKLAIHMSKVHADHALLQKQLNKTEKKDYKMVVKEGEAENQTWVLADNEDNNGGSQLLTIQTADGESIPYTLLTDEMLGEMVHSNNRIVEIVLDQNAVKEEAEETEGALSMGMGQLVEGSFTAEL